MANRYSAALSRLKHLDREYSSRLLDMDGQRVKLFFFPGFVFFLALLTAGCSDDDCDPASGCLDYSERKSEFVGCITSFGLDDCWPEWRPIFDRCLQGRQNEDAIRICAEYVWLYYNECLEHYEGTREECWPKGRESQSSSEESLGWRRNGVQHADSHPLQFTSAPLRWPRGHG